MNLLDKLKGLDAGMVQSVRGMSVIPLTDEKGTEYNDVAEFEEVTFDGTSGYGVMEYKNSSDRVGIVPSNSFVISKEPAQDHAMGSAGLVPVSGKTTFRNACCIESSQGGYLTKNNEKHDFGVLPLMLRGMEYGMRMKKSYDKIWYGISKFNKELSCKSGQHLSYFFEEYKDELENFLAEFEIVPGQIGALVFFGKDLVGMEIAPNRGYWNSVWNWLIRGCYGSEYLRRSKIGQGYGNLKLPDLSKMNDLDDISDRIKKYCDNVRKDLMNSINPHMRVDRIHYQEENNFKLDYIEIDKKFVGDVISVDDKIIYISSVRK